ncbi:MAG: Gfo/Idh/MocA family protein [Acidimicrobiales bacterium]
MEVPDARVVLVGAHGHGRWHLRHLRALSSRSDIRLVGVCDTRPLGPSLQGLAGQVPVAAELAELIRMTDPDVTIVCTPIHTHTDLTLIAAGAGSHVLLEKPPAPTSAEFARLVDGVRAAGRSCQVGFQSLGSRAVVVVRSLIAEGAVGEVRGIGAAGTAVRDTRYYARGEWAGRRRIGEQPVVDGVLTNPFAHSIASALRIDGSDGPGDVGDVEVELYRAHAIEADDTSCVRFRTARGTLVCVAATLCAARAREPYVVVHGDRGRITWWYTRDEVHFDGTTTQHPRTDLLENLVEHIHDPAVPLLVPPESTGAFMDVVEAIRLAPEPRAIPAADQRADRTGRHLRRIVSGIDHAVQRSAAELRLFSELDLAWATP